MTEQTNLTEPADGVDTSLSTGDLSVDAALQRLARLDQLKLDRHADEYEQIHASLREVLERPTTDRAPDRPAPDGTPAGGPTPAEPGPHLRATDHGSPPSSAQITSLHH